MANEQDDPVEPDDAQGIDDALDHDEALDPEEAVEEDEGSSIGRALGGTMTRAVRSQKTAGFVAGMEDRISAFRRERKIGKGTLRSTYVVAYAGYIAQGRAHTRLRVTEEPVVPDSAEALTDTELLRSNLRRFVALAFPGVKVSVTLGDAQDLAETDRHGYAVGQLKVGELPPGWIDYEVTTQPVDPGEPPVTARGQVLVPDPAAAVWVVSDIDDTVLQTGLAEGFTAVKNTLLGQAHTRRAVPGMASLYRAIEAGLPGNGRTPFFYLSTGPWSLYDMLTEFLRVRGFPAGPMFLTDWGPQERYITRSGTEHKRTNLRRLFEQYPQQSFVLIGDSGQKDAETYSLLAAEYPESVRLIIILDVGLAEQAADMSERQDDARTSGLPFRFVADAREAAVVLADEGIIEAAAVSSVAAAYERS